MHADIAQRGRAQNGIGDGMRQHVRVGMAFQPEFARHGDAAQNQRSARSNPVNIPSQAGSDFAQSAASLEISSRRNRWARSISVGLVILMLRSLPMTTVTSTSRRSTMLASSVP